VFKKCKIPDEKILHPGFFIGNQSENALAFFENAGYIIALSLLKQTLWSLL